MRGTKAKRIRKITSTLAPKKFKHGQRIYGRNKTTGEIRAVGWRMAYKLFKKIYKHLNRGIIERDMREALKHDVHAPLPDYGLIADDGTPINNNTQDKKE